MLVYATHNPIPPIHFSRNLPLSLPSNGITQDIFRDIMPPHHLNHDLLAAMFTTLPPPPPATPPTCGKPASPG